MLIIHVACVILKCCFSDIPLWNNFIGSGAAGIFCLFCGIQESSPTSALTVVIFSALSVVLKQH